MASAIISNTIDENFPVAGQDNDSQGFRDNFNVIKTALSVAKEEITDLQEGVVRLDRETNEFNGNEISGANLVANTLKTVKSYETGLPISQNISFNEGYVYVIRAEADITLRLEDLPLEEYGAIRFVLTGDDTDRIITFTRVGGGEVIKTDGSAVFTSNTVTVNSSTDPVVIEAFSYNGGSTIYLHYVGTFA